MTDEMNLTAYRASRESAAFTELPGSGWLRLTGRDRLDLLNRLSTNKVKDLAPGGGAPTVLTNANGRVMAVVTVYAGEGEVFLRTAPEQPAGVARYLNSMIFWQDQVEVTNLTGEVAQFALYGPRAQGALERLAGMELSDAKAYSHRQATIAGQPVTLHRGGALEPFAWMLVAPAAATESVRAALAGLPFLDTATTDLLRIERGLPAWGRELSEEVTPLETGLLAAINYDKGCYTGQEIIARQTNYDKVTRNLVGLELPLPQHSPALRPAAGEEGRWGEVRGPGRGGFVGSVVYSPILDKTIALAVVPRELSQPGTEVEIQRGEERLTAVVRSLPLVS